VLYCQPHVDREDDIAKFDLADDQAAILSKIVDRIGTMTVVFSAARSDLIIMAADSTVARDFKNRREYATGQKVFPYTGLGCIATWGTRDVNRLSEILMTQPLPVPGSTVTDLVKFVDEYLRNEYRPHEMGLDDVGYHVGGFDERGRPRLFHVFWGLDRPRSPEQTERQYRCEDLSPGSSDAMTMLYNGRNDLAEMVVHSLINEINAGRDTRYEIRLPVDLVGFADFVLRFAGEVTQEVGPPFTTLAISRSNMVRGIANSGYCPLVPKSIAKTLRPILLDSQGR
jgi:hypothetical protein